MVKILVRAPNWIGDQVLALPFFYALRMAFPDAHIGVLCPNSFKDIQYLPWIQEIIPLPSRESGFSGSIGFTSEIIKRIKERGPWEKAYVLTPSFSSALQMTFAGVPYRVGWNSDYRKIFLTHSIEGFESEFKHRADAYLDLLGVNRPQWNAQEFFSQPRMEHLREDEKTDDLTNTVMPQDFDVLTLWNTSVQIKPPTEDYWVLAPGSRAPSRRWPIQYFFKAARHLEGVLPKSVVIVGGVEESQLAMEFAKLSDFKVLDWTAKGHVSAHVSLFRGAQVVWANDSGLAHVASLSGAKVVIPWGAGQPKHTAPLGPGLVQIRLNAVGCWPCEKNDCSMPESQKFNCLAGITPVDIADETRKILRARA